MKPEIVQKPANAANFTKGRSNTAIKKITFHHIVGSLDSAYTVFQNPNRQGSAHFGVGDGRIWQFVSIDDTAWANANWASNLESITIEHEGDWRNGYWNEGVINTSAQLVAWLRTVYPNIGFNRHRDVAQNGTICPADLPVEEIWNRATKLLERTTAPVNPPTTVNLQITDIVNRKVVLNKEADLWDLNFSTWQTAKSVKKYAKGTEIEISATTKHPLGGLYYMTEYSFSKGIMNGFNSIDCDEIVPPTPPIPPVPPVPPIPPTPEYPNWFIQFWIKLWEAIKNILGVK